MKTLRTLAATLLLAATTSAQAWGDAGHEIVARVADHYLQPAVRTRITALLKTDTTGLTAKDIAAQATWADKYRDSDRNSTKLRYQQTREWHFTDIELGSQREDGDLDAACFGHPPLPAGTAASQGPAHACLLDKLDQFITELGAPGTAPEERLRALQFVLHLVGDLHQPLHSSDDHDRGGNTKNVTAAGLSPGNLHRYWDVEFVRRLGARPPAVARSLIAGITAKERASWAQGRPEDWARDSFGVALRTTYGKLPAPSADGSHALDAAYLAAATKATSLQLSKAGVRLATVLNAAFQ
ncbi:S1/P1 nuclease [soil metagenome]